MLRWKDIVLLFIFILLPSLPAHAKDFGCQKAKSELDCVIKFRTVIYQKNPEYFWKVLYKARDHARICNSAKKTSQFLGLVRISNTPIELQEFLSEEFETLCAENPICFKKAKNLLDSKLQVKLNKSLNNPLFRDIDELNICR
ncbi:hypothetical protein [Methyloglobulus sp.]|uniref:hypothetical protein n=1 Tax=Methyloglobulus sp. TaxID=2518622 RepID=UPI003988C6D0